MAISEAVEDAATHDDTSYALGSVLNHVLLHQTVIGQEAQRQLELAGETGVDVVIGCVGGGSNFAGLALPFVRDKIAGADIEIIACEPAACPTLTRGPFAYDFGDTAQLTPLVRDAHARPRLRAAGHPRGRAALPRRGADRLAAHARRPAAGRGLPPERRVRRRRHVRPHRGDRARARERPRHQGRRSTPPDAPTRTGTEQAILFNLSGHGHFDMAAYDAYLHDRLEDHELPRGRDRPRAACDRAAAQADGRRRVGCCRCGARFWH